MITNKETYWQQVSLKIGEVDLLSWQLYLGGQLVLTAFSDSPIKDAVTKENRKLLAEALIEHLNEP